MKTKFLNKPWFKAKNAGAWCIYYSTKWEGRILKNFICECVSEEAADGILTLQRESLDAAYERSMDQLLSTATKENEE